jgi:hypothetical protein
MPHARFAEILGALTAGRVDFVVGGDARRGHASSTVAARRGNVKSHSTLRFSIPDAGRIG